MSPNGMSGLFQQSTLSSAGMFPPIEGAVEDVELDMASLTSEERLRENRRIRDNTHENMRREFISKVKARAFKALHIGVPVSFDKKNI